MNKIAVRKSDNKILSFGSEDMSRFDPANFDIIDTVLETLPDEIRFCIYDYTNQEVIVDDVYKQQVLATEAQAEQERQEAKQHISLENLAGLTNAQIDNYIDNNVTNLTSAKGVLKKLAKWNRALTRVQMLRQDN